jgi:hypothetical protein
MLQKMPDGADDDSHRDDADVLLAHTRRARMLKNAAHVLQHRRRLDCIKPGRGACLSRILSDNAVKQERAATAGSTRAGRKAAPVAEHTDADRI